MPSLPPPIWAELFFGGAWNGITRDLRQTSAVTASRGLSAESFAAAEPTTTECTLDNRGHDYSPRNAKSRLRGLIGRNTPFRWGYRVGSPWAEFAGGLGSDAIQTPDSAALDIAGDFDLRVDMALEDWSESQMICLRYVPSANACWALEMVNGFPTFLWSPDGTFASRIDQTATAELKAHNGRRLALRVTLDIDNGAGGYELRFYTGRTVDDEEWDLLGEPITGSSTTSVFTGTAELEFGHGSSFNALPSGGTLNRMRGKAFALKLLNGIAGTVAVAMSVAAATPGGTSFTDATGLVWTKQGSAVFSNKHIRMAGEVPAWPPTRDLSGNDTYTQITPTGISRRMDAGNKPQDSALLRYIKAQGPIECWPLTDGSSSTVGTSLVGGSNMRQKIDAAVDTPVEFGAGRLADWIEPVIAVKPDSTGRFIGTVPVSSSAASKWSVDLFLRGGGNESAGGVVIRDRGAGTDADNAIEFFLVFNGNLDTLATLWTAVGETSAPQSLLTAGSPANIYDEGLHHIRLTMDPGVSTTAWEMYTDGVLLDSGTIPVVVKAVSTIDLRFGFLTVANQTMTERGFGYITYWDGTGPSAADMWGAATGFPGERAGARIERLATESGYTASTSGELAHQQLMGVQDRKKLLQLLNESSLTNFGYLLERRDALEVIHRSHSTLWNQPPALTLDFSAGLISAPFKPADDDKLTENDVSVSRAGGAVPVRAVLESGELSVQDFPAGAGRYDNAYTYSLYTDDQAANVAYMRLHLGTYNGVRYTRITLDLANPRVFQMIDAILRLDVGDMLRLTNVPEDHGPDDVDVLVQGYTEEAGPQSWKITLNCVPAEPWTAFVASSDRYSRADTNGSSLNAALTSSATSMSVATAAGNTVWVDSTGYAAEFPFDVRVGGVSGEVVRVTAVSGTSSPQTFTVVRGVNGVRIAHDPAEDVRLAHPVYIPL
ncbi:hypothetical protein ACFYPC_11415 [Streptomyces sp. NPDC005808]|uniref:hypothetical protein n=1 Tax=Streptomyces sp. NPDC005808 TaxID=3364734 RepID=UPI0036D10E29